MENIMQTIGNIFNKFFTGIINFLPGSPFRRFQGMIGDIPFLAELNWFFPVSEVIVVLEAWLAVITIYYTYSAILRFIRLIK